MNSMIFVLYCIPVIICLILQGWGMKVSGKGETKRHLVFFLASWIPGVNIIVAVYTLFIMFVWMSLTKFFGKDKGIK